MNKDINSKKLRYIKAGLFLLAGFICCFIIQLENPMLQLAALLAVAILCFAWASYFIAKDIPMNKCIDRENLWLIPLL
ncbi:MAG: hypothetical protein JEZ07_06675 [Phycisphaerae bacterium]|nr:hypothetical protein [Phycisphaerae bacterium]